MVAESSTRTENRDRDHDYHFARAHHLGAEELMREARWMRSAVLRFMERAKVRPVRRRHYP